MSLELLDMKLEMNECMVIIQTMMIEAAQEVEIAQEARAEAVQGEKYAVKVKVKRKKLSM